MKVCMRSIGAVILWLGLSALPAMGSETQFVEGKAYVRVPPVGYAGTGEVVEFFSYGCVYCQRFAPLAQRLAESLPAGFKFRLVPSGLRPDWEVYARAFYAAKELGVAQRTHLAAFDFVMNECHGRASLEQMAAFYSRYGIPRDRFLNTARSSGVSARVARDSRLERAWRIDGTPTVVVDGTYMTEDVSSVQELAELVSWLLKHRTALSHA